VRQSLPDPHRRPSKRRWKSKPAVRWSPGFAQGLDQDLGDGVLKKTVLRADPPGGSRPGTNRKVVAVPT
jgi:hypothetical protein